MYYEEAEMNGRWWWKSSPDGGWVELTIAMYVAKIKKLNKQIEELTK